MTTPLDDGLATSAPLLNPTRITADWLDVQPGYDTVETVDSIKQLGEQIGPEGLEVSQSIDDGLPGPVTMTSGNDACGSLTATLVGRPGVTAVDSTLAWNALTTSGTGTGTSVAVTLPADLTFWDFVIVAITVVSEDSIWETTVEPGETGQWFLLGEQLDMTATPYRTWVFGRQHFTGAVAPVFEIPASAQWGYVAASVKCGRTHAGALVPVTPNQGATAAEGVSAVTAHTAPAVHLPSRGWTVAVFGTGSGAGPITPTGDAVSVVASASGPAMLMARSPLRVAPGDYTITANTALATATTGMVHIPLVVRERDFQDATAYFSPFNTESPIVGFERDTAPVEAAISVVTPEGPVETPVFTGVMADIPFDSRSAKVEAVSSTRLLLDTSVTLPTVHGKREGCTTDWLAGYLMAHGKQYNGVAIGRNTRFWAPLHGGLHPYMDGPASFPGSIYYSTARTPGTQYRKWDPEVIDGPFVTAMYAQQKNDEVIRNTIALDTVWETQPPGIENPLTYDLHSQQNSKGRFTMWIRGDAADAAPAALGGGDDWLFAMTLWNQNPNGSAGDYTRFQINSDRTYTVWLGNSQVISTAPIPLPADGAWHFIGFAWSYATGEARVRRDGTQIYLSGHSATLADLPASQASLYSQGLFTGCIIQSNLPTAEYQMEFGPECWGAQPFTSTGGAWFWTGVGNPPGAPSLNATYRPTRQPLAAVAESTPVQGWPTLQALAQSTLSHLRLNESDNLEFLPLDYFGETEQMTVTDANMLDTFVNAGELGVTVDASKMRNVVTSEYQEVRVDAQHVPVLDITTLITIPKGETFMVFALDTQVAELHGAANWQFAASTITKLTATQIATPSLIPGDHVMSVNFLSDGTGTVIASSMISGQVVSWTNSTVTVRFRNTYSAPLYLVNNGDQVPFLRIRGYPVRRTDAYTTVRDASSVALRRERGLTTGMEWIQDRATAEKVTSTLVGLISRPRPQVSVTVMGDPRRKPGDLVSLVDASGTRADGTWRVLGIRHDSNGPMYVQDLELVRVGDIGVWDQSLWDQVVWGE